MILSFAYTTNAYLAGRKTVTRRRWRQRQLERWQRAWDEGRLVHDAWSSLPFVPGAHRLGYFRLTCRPYVERLGDMPESDLAAEGGLWGSRAEFIELFGDDPDLEVAVVRFEPIIEGIIEASPLLIDNAEVYIEIGGAAEPPDIDTSFDHFP